MTSQAGGCNSSGLADFEKLLRSEQGEEESPETGCDIHLTGRTAPRTRPQQPANASSAPTGRPPLVTKETPRQKDCFPAPLRLPPEWPEQPQADEKRALPLHPFHFRPCWGRKRKRLASAATTPGGRCHRGQQKRLMTRLL